MAIYVFKMKTFTRNAGSRGSRATSAAAYRAGERIQDLRTGALYDHRHRQDVLHKQLVLPAGLGAGGRPPQWAASRSALWNAAERAETRSNARVAREFTLALPHELGASARLQLAQGFAHQLADRYHTAVDLVLHAPRGDARNFHAHLLTTTREVGAAGLGRKAELELSGTERHRRGLAPWRQEREWLRERWAEVTNEALREAHLQARVSHRAPAQRDLSRAPWLPLWAYHMEREGRHSFVAERIRARHRATLEASLERAASVRPDVRSPERAAAPALDGAQVGWLGRIRERAQATLVAMRDRLRDRLPDRVVEPPRQAELAPCPAAVQPPALQLPAVQPPAMERAHDWPVNEVARKAALAWAEHRQKALSQGLERGGADRQYAPGRALNSGLQRDGPQQEELKGETLQRDHGIDYDLDM